MASISEDTGEETPLQVTFPLIQSTFNLGYHSDSCFKIHDYLSIACL